MTTDYKSGTMPNVTCQFLEGLLVVSCMILFFYPHFFLPAHV